MNRLEALTMTPTGRPQFLTDEVELYLAAETNLLDGDNKTDMDSGVFYLTSHRFLWIKKGSEDRKAFALSLAMVDRVEEEKKSFFKASTKVIVRLKKRSSNTPPMISSVMDYIQVKFLKGDIGRFITLSKQALSEKSWILEASAIKGTLPSSLGDNEGFSTRTAGVSGVLRNVEKKKVNTDIAMDQAFSDLDALVGKAKLMVVLAELFAVKVKRVAEGNADNGEVVSEAERSEFKSYLMSLGLANPVTKQLYGDGSTYHRELSKELADFLCKPLADCGGIMVASDAYCLYNRARGGAGLISPDDLMTACELFSSLKLPLLLYRFSSGVMVIQLSSYSNDVINQALEDLAKDNTYITAMVVSEIRKTPLVQSREQLLTAETCGYLCRDNTIEGLRFYPNLFKSIVF